MAHSPDDEKVVPLGIVLMIVGLIVVLTAVAVFFVLPRAAPQIVEIIQPAAMPAAQPAAGADVALLPETPLQAGEGETGALAEELLFESVSGQPERIIIPDINLDAPVGGIGLAQVISNDQTYYQWQVPSQYRAGWHNTSAPLGEAGNTVLNGHHNIHGEVFRDLYQLEEGEQIILQGQTQTYTYTISTIDILPERGQSLDVRIQNAQAIAPTDDERLTLVTCWPYEDNSHRLVVVAHPADGTANSTSLLDKTEIQETNN